MVRETLSKLQTVDVNKPKILHPKESQILHIYVSICILVPFFVV